MEFETFTDDLMRLKEWLIERECPVVAMESTGPYWTPVHNTLEGFFQVILVNARHMRNVPGRKTDLSDSRWLAGLLRHALLKAAFIRPSAISRDAFISCFRKRTSRWTRSFRTCLD